MLCAICQCELHDGESRAACPTCQAPYHADCWQENGGCAIYGCPSAAPTQQRDALETPVSFWGQEHKPCPACGQTILAAAVRCRFCGAAFDSARPEDRNEFEARTARQRRLPALRRHVLWLFVFSVLPCTAPFAALAGSIWYLSHRRDIRALPALYSGLCRLALAVAIGQTTLTFTMATLFLATRSA